MSENIYVQNLALDSFSSIGASPEELLSYALDEVGLLGQMTMINGKSAREMAESFYQKRQRVRQNSRLGNLLISEHIISKEQLIAALSYHVTHEVPLGQALVQLNSCTQEQIESALARQEHLRRRLS